MKKLAALVLAVCMTFALCACGSTAQQAPAAEAPAAEAPVAEASFVKGADIVAPEGKSLAVLPVDQVAEEEIRIAMIGIVSNPFDESVYEGHEFAQKVLADRNCVCDYITSPGLLNVVELQNTYRNCIAAGYNAIVCKGFNEQMATVIAEAKAEGIVTGLVNTQAGPNDESITFWGQNGVVGGQKLGEIAVELTGGEGKYAIITGSFNYSGHEERRTGFRGVADQYPGMELVGEFENDDLYEKAYDVATNLITANPDLKLIYVTAGGPAGAAKAIEDAGKAGEIILVCHDWMPETVPYIRSGVISACLDQEPFTQGYAPVVECFNYLVAGIEPQKINDIEGQIATPENVAELIPE